MKNTDSPLVGRFTAQVWFQLVFALMILVVLLGAVAGAQVIGNTNWNRRCPPPRRRTGCRARW